MNITQSITNKALELGFDLVHTIPASPSQSIEAYKQWLSLGYAGNMDYLKKHLENKQDIHTIMPEIRSVITLAINYRTTTIPCSKKNNPSLGVISSYAWGEDYHQIVRKKLESLRAFIENHVPHQKKSRVYVDTGPILEREYAHRGSLGWFGKNSMIINWKKGSWLFLAEILLDIELAYSPFSVRGDCGSCTRCIEACPTNAIVADGLIDSRRCISYLTIELKGAIPSELRSAIGNLIFGCDICQDVCPWNRKAPVSNEAGFQPTTGNIMPNLISLMSLSPKEFNQRFKTSPIKRTKRKGLLRNVAIALGNWGRPEAIPALKQGLADEQPLIRMHSAWGLGQIEHQDAHDALAAAQKQEQDTGVLQEIRGALLVHHTPKL
ncbi:MAG: tRNA epoxyqueuosine(34) reductase QueG [SAR324 cluster bacterium]|nr:tRNA epoxyqueuosine(34) reductase QueG [SAR324 cluster bacterium]